MREKSQHLNPTEGDLEPLAPPWFQANLIHDDDASAALKRRSTRNEKREMTRAMRAKPKSISRVLNRWRQTYAGVLLAVDPK